MPLSRGLAETRHDGCLASFPPKTGDRAGLAPPRRSNLASVAVELIHDSRQEDGCGRLGNYSDCLKHDRENYTLLARGSRLARDGYQKSFQINLSGHAVQHVAPNRVFHEYDADVATSIALDCDRSRFKDRHFRSLAC